MILELNNEQSPVREMTAGENFNFDHRSDFIYAGGLPDEIKPDEIKYGNFDGCIGQILINKIIVELDKPVNFGEGEQCRCYSCEDW